MSTLKSKATAATFWSGIDSFARHGLRFGLSLVLARLLSPEDYGVVALLAVFVALASSFIDSGFSLALVRKENPTEIDLSSVFFFSVTSSTLLGGLLSLISPWIAAFYRLPVLQPLTYALALSLVVGSLGAIHTVLLTKALNFRLQCLISLASSAVSGAIAVILALRGFGVWSLAIQTLAGSVLYTVLLWVFCDWRPQPVFSWQSIRSLFSFGAYLLLGNLLETLYTRLSTLLIGKLFSPRDVGIYNRAETASQLPTSLLIAIPARVAFPLFAEAKNDKTLLRAGLRQALTICMFFNAPVMIGVAVVAEPMVICLYGREWLPSVPYLRILALSAVLWPLHILNLSVLNAQGFSRQAFRLELIKKGIGLLLLSIACFFGIAAIAWSVVTMSVISIAINTHYSRILLHYGPVAQLRDILPFLLVGSLMALFATLVGRAPLAPALLLIIQVLAGSLTYLGLSYLLRLEAFFDALRIIRQFRT